MNKNKVINIICIVTLVLTITLVAVCTSVYSKRNIPSSNSKIDFCFDMSKWNYDENNNVYYQLNIDYCEKSKINENEKFDIFVPGEYLTGRKNSDGTYKCEINSKGERNGYKATTSPMIIGIEVNEEVEQKIHTKYNYEEIADYINEGYVYIWPGFRGLKDNNNSIGDEEYSNAIVDGITDLKALIKFCRFNKNILPGNTEKIITFGKNGGGTKSAILGSSGDSELYSSKLLAIGAIMVTDEGRVISDSVNGTMCCSPTKNIEIDRIASDWSIRQYINEKEKETLEHASQYGDYINNMKLKSEDGTLLYLNETKTDKYSNGTYYNYMLSELENSINTFLQNTIFPFYNKNNNMTYLNEMDYIEALNVTTRWIDYNNKRVKIHSFKDMAFYFNNKENIVECKTCLNEYNPYYFLSNKYNGIDSSYLSKYWNICTLIDDNNINILPEENLKLILEKNENIRNVRYSCIWAKEYSDEEKNVMIFDNLKTWIKNYL